ncbi:hypothetical protein ATKI12_4808 [Kitasatospora sp. Ki12]
MTRTPVPHRVASGGAVRVRRQEEAPGGRGIPGPVALRPRRRRRPSRPRDVVERRRDAPVRSPDRTHQQR